MWTHDDPLYGKQEGRFFHGYYMNYCYLPLYIFCGEFLLCARLRSSNIDAPRALQKSSSGSSGRSEPLAGGEDHRPGRFGLFAVTVS